MGMAVARTGEGGLALNYSLHLSLACARDGCCCGCCVGAAGRSGSWVLGVLLEPSSVGEVGKPWCVFLLVLFASRMLRMR